MNVNWTDALIERLHDLRVIQRCSFSQIAVEMGISRPAISRQCLVLQYPDVAEHSGGHKFTDAEDATLTEMWKAGAAPGDIADTLGRTVSSIANRASTLGLRTPRAPAPVLTDDERRARKRAENARFQERKRLSNPSHVTPDWPQADIDLLTELWKTPMSASQIGKKMGRSHNAITGKVLRMGLQARPSPIARRTGPQLPTHTRRQMVTLQAFDSFLDDAAPEPEFIRLRIPRQKIERSQRVRECMFTDGDKRAWIMCDAPTEPGSLWCSAHQFCGESHYVAEAFTPQAGSFKFGERA